MFFFSFVLLPPPPMREIGAECEGEEGEDVLGLEELHFPMKWSPVRQRAAALLFFFFSCIYQALSAILSVVSRSPGEYGFEFLPD